MVVSDYDKQIMDYVRSNFIHKEKLPQSDEGLWFLLNSIVEDTTADDHTDLLDLINQKLT